MKKGGSQLKTIKLLDKIIECKGQQIVEHILFLVGLGGLHSLNNTVVVFVEENQTSGGVRVICSHLCNAVCKAQSHTARMRFICIIGELNRNVSL